MSSTENNKQPEPTKEEDEKVIKTLEEDDEFEDFPEDDKQWTTDVKLKEENLWEEDWDDDDNQDQFSLKLKEEILKTQKSAANAASK
ncbi:hypothetical protein KGF54_004614 [Candida jiufengensis]|uniref:uncharacterized protein n=1 Tax=Candida jiufengensis TaxID=497108 RepID=UPI00222449D5|nr:uncharacterized protein KGF54_004614 [Candida jiufengensis]KAI5951540.1 hypothetical protein KGF54_004614 [Candida jiufengensis]